MIDVSLIDNNLLALHFQPIWLNRLLLGVQKEFAQTVVERNQGMEVVDFLGFDEMTFGDEERLHQAFGISSRTRSNIHQMVARSR